MGGGGGSGKHINVIYRCCSISSSPVDRLIAAKADGGGGWMDGWTRRRGGGFPSHVAIQAEPDDPESPIRVIDVR